MNRVGLVPFQLVSPSARRHRPDLTCLTRIVGTALVALALSLLGSTGYAQRGGQGGFPHQRHERLFPLCESCHAGIPGGDAATSMPSEASCRECHNGTDERVVSWRYVARGQGLLRFSHAAHRRDVDSTGRSCVSCHGAAGTPRMAVHRAEPATCLGCHTHRATNHLADDNRCAVCHVPLTAAPALTSERIAALPRPVSHEQADFAAAHQPATPVAAASCAVCHARESCARCHVNAATQPVIAALGRDARVARLMAGRPAVYPVPADHHADAFDRGHGTLARANVDRCGACHARPSCTTCHIGSGASDVLARLPLAERGGAPGVLLRLQPVRLRAASPLLTARGDTDAALPRIVRVHGANVRGTHGVEASAGALSCAGCHEQRFCSDCHAGEGMRRFHAANFVQRHAADSYGRETECSSCHNAELFCRSCHRESGLASKGRLDVAFHDAQPLWLLQHGRAARQGLQSCATCHAQRDCMTCHSTIGWGVNPHGPGFRAERLSSRNATQCLMCHLQVPGRR